MGGEHPAIRAPLKSPLRSASVGTNAVRAVPRSSRFHSRFPKKCSVSLMTGPPIDPPKSLPAQLLLGLISLLQEIVLRVEAVVAAGVEGAAAELVGPGTGHDVDLRAALAPPNSGP